MVYGPERQLVKQVKDSGSETTTYINGLLEKIDNSEGITYRYHVTAAGKTVAVINDTTAKSPETHYLHRDHLDSIIATSNESGQLLERFHYDPFGKRRLAIVDNGDELGTQIHIARSDRGFTGHRHLASVDIIHMNGRVYDATTGRFLSADPHIQFAGYSQSYNRYSYLMNNPLNATDPSGYFLSKLFKKIKNVFKKIVRTVVKVVRKVVSFVKENWKMVVSVAIMVVAPYAIAALASTGSALVGGAFTAGLSASGALVAGAVGGGLAGLVTTGSLKGALTGAISGAAFAGIGNAFAAGGRFHGVGLANKLRKAGLHGLVGGVRGKLSGASFSKSFLSAGITEMASPLVGIIPGNGIGSTAAKVVASGVVGGTATAAAGGQFKDGFNTGAMQYALNNGAHTILKGSSQTDAGHGISDDRLPHRFTSDGLRNRNIDMIDFKPGGSEDVRSTILNQPRMLDIPGNSLTRAKLTDVGNYNFGFVGAKNGYDLDTLLIIGDIDQHGIIPGIGKQGCYFCVPQDNPTDANMIKTGYEEYQTRIGY